MSVNRSLFVLLLLGVACQQPYTQGKILYESACGSCHMSDGTGLAGLIPPLAGSDLLRNSPDLLPCIITRGMEGKIQVNGQWFDQVMAPVTGINEVEMANILNYIQTEWGDPSQFYSPDRIRQIHLSCGTGPVNLAIQGKE
ncbi:MAG: cytochrome c [Saprospiraceae bacterium]|nr:cytochrome c [Saprospiraceae bacterium]